MRRFTFLNYSLHSPRPSVHNLKERALVGPARMQRTLITSRRKFLKRTLDGVVFLTVAKLLPHDFVFAQADGSVRNDLRYFSPKEYLILQAVAERMVDPALPGNPTVKEIDVAKRADQFVAAADQEIQDQFHQLLTVFNAPFFTFLFDLRFSSFINMAPEDKDSYLEDWMTSNLALRRTGFQALKRLCLSMFYTDSRSWKEIGYEGMFLPEDRK